MWYKALVVIDGCRKFKGVSHDCIESSICQHQSPLKLFLRTRNEGRFLSRSTSAPKIPMRFGKVFGPQAIRSRDMGPKQTNKNKRAASYLFSVLTMNPHGVLLLFSCRGRCTHNRGITRMWQICQTSQLGERLTRKNTFFFHLFIAAAFIFHESRCRQRLYHLLCEWVDAITSILFTKIRC